MLKSVSQAKSTCRTDFPLSANASRMVAMHVMVQFGWRLDLDQAESFERCQVWNQRVLTLVHL